MFIQLDGHAYWFYAKIKSVSTQICLNHFLRKLERFSLVFSFLAFTVHSYLIAHARALTRFARDNPILVAPAQMQDLT